MRKLPSTRKTYQVRLIIPDNGMPIIEYQQLGSFVSPKKPTKTIQFVDLLFADKKHDTGERWAFSIYSINKTVTFLPQDETIMNEWLTKIRELHSDLYPDFKKYDAIFEANLLAKGLARTMHIEGLYRLALCKDSIDLIPVLTNEDQQQQIIKAPITTATTFSTTGSLTKSNHHHHPSEHHHHLPQHLPSHQRFSKRHPLLASKTIELVLRSIRRCGHTDSNFYIESGRYSQIGEGDLWLALNKKSTARHLHELLLATMKLSSNDDQFLYKAPRSRSGSSSDNSHLVSEMKRAAINNINTSPMFLNDDKKIEEDSGYLPMA
jgi:hypothetical protein